MAVARLKSLIGNGQLILILFAVALVSADNFADPDLWMHILAGRIVLAGHIPPLSDPFSYSATGFPWRDHEWFAEAAFALSYDFLGVVGLKLLKVFCATLVIVALAIGIAQTRAGTGHYRRLVLIVVAMLLVEPMQFRPQIFTFAMLGVLLAILAAEIYRGKGPLWILVPLFALWPNFHAGYAVGLGALAVATTVVAAQALRNPELRTKALRLALVTLGCAFASALNPFGLGAAKIVTHSVADPLIRQLVVEWWSEPQALAHLWTEGSKLLILIGIAPLLFFIAFLATLVRAPDLEDAAMVAIALVFIAAGLYAVRNISLAVIAVAIPLAHHSALAFGGADDRPPASWLMGAMAALLILAGGTFSNHLTTWGRMPLGAVSFMQRNHLHGNILNQLEWGDYLAWHDPNSRIFIDTRNEILYPDSIIREYARFYYGLAGGDRLLDAYPNEYVLITTKSKAFETMLSQHRWRLIYRDQNSALFARRT